MAVTGTATPKLLKDPGYLFWAPLGTPEPTHTVAASKFTDPWPVAWIPLGATEEGSTFSNEMSIEPIRVAELFDPVAYEVTEQAGSIAFALANWTLANMKRAMNGGSLQLVSGTGATALTRLDPPDPEEITRCQIGWESVDGSARLIGRQCLNGGTLESSFQRAPSKALIPFELQMERPTNAKRFSLWGAGAERAGV